MKVNVLLIIAKQVWRNAFNSKVIYALMFLFYILLAYAGYSGWKTYTVQNHIRNHYQQVVRQSWENNPDKHPHRMAHFGSFAFRLKHPLSMFDFGLESFTGNAVFLEAHKQNTVNFSEASFSTGLLRFGEISTAMLLQVVLPLIIIFLGFSTVASERENGTLKVMLCQNAGWHEILIGKSIGLIGLSLLFYIPVILVTLLLLFSTKDIAVTGDVLLRYTGTAISYLLFAQVVSIITILISAASSASKEALIKLLAVWLIFVILLPKTTQALGNYFYPSPSKIEFEAAIEKALIKEGDSHNPDDPHYKTLRDSLLQVYKVDSVEQLPFNYSGFLMKEGEQISAAIYTRHLNALLGTYEKQNSITSFATLFNPFMAIRNISMALAGTDFSSYVHFQRQAEDYRYQLAQQMNELQMKLISNTKLAAHEKPYSISRDHWREFPDFKHHFLNTTTALEGEVMSILSLMMWSMASVLSLIYLSRTAKAI